jgi:hypothetical protein
MLENEPCGLQEYAKTNWFWIEINAMDHKGGGALASSYVVGVSSETLI